VDRRLNGMVRVVIFGQGLVATHFAVGLERLKAGIIEDYGVPLGRRVPIDYRDVEIVASYDVDDEKVGKTIYDIALKSFPKQDVPETLKKITVGRGIHQGSLRGLPFKVHGREEGRSLTEAIDELIDEWRSLKPDVFVNVITTEPVDPIGSVDEIEKRIRDGNVTASQAYAYAVAKYSGKYGPVAMVNAIPSPIANDPGFVELFRRNNGVVFGDDGATGATPLTADLLEHLSERRRRVIDIAQFNIGGNTDFLALDIPERNDMKKMTKSRIVEDILGYDVPHYIKPTGYLEPLGDKKFVAMIIEYYSFNGFKDEWYISARINDSPALAGLLVDLVRIGKLSAEKGHYGTIYEVNAYYMKNPGPAEGKSIAKVKAYEKLLDWINKIKP
jgi:myo-inositol-1-phosphate synthase